MVTSPPRPPDEAWSRRLLCVPACRRRRRRRRRFVDAVTVVGRCRADREVHDVGADTRIAVRDRADDEPRRRARPAPRSRSPRTRSARRGAGSRRSANPEFRPALWGTGRGLRSSPDSDPSAPRTPATASAGRPNGIPANTPLSDAGALSTMSTCGVDPPLTTMPVAGDAVVAKRLAETLSTYVCVRKSRRHRMTVGTLCDGTASRCRVRRWAHGHPAGHGCTDAPAESAAARRSAWRRSSPHRAAARRPTSWRRRRPATGATGMEAQSPPAVDAR